MRPKAIDAGLEGFRRCKSRLKYIGRIIRSKQEKNVSRSASKCADKTMPYISSCAVEHCSIYNERIYKGHENLIPTIILLVCCIQSISKAAEILVKFIQAFVLIDHSIVKTVRRRNSLKRRKNECIVCS